MAYGEKYYGQWKDRAGTTHEVSLLLDGYASTATEITILQPIPCTITRRGDADIQLTNAIIGSELTFSFIVPSASLATYDAIFESEYKDWKVEYYYNSVLTWVGMLQPENFSRAYIKTGDYYQFNLSATDGLANLKDIEFVDASTGAQFSDRVSLIQTIKRALAHTGLELDFRVQLGTYENSLMTSSECALSEINCDNSRFTKVDDDGLEKNENCYSIIEKVLTPFTCIIMQSGAKWWIVNHQEKNSYYFPIPWSSLTVGTRTANDLRVDISDFNFLSKGDMRLVRPFKTVNVTFRNRNVLDNIIDNGDFTANNVDAWNASADISLMQAEVYGSDYEMSVIIDTDYSGIPAATPYIYADAESITIVGTSDTLILRYKIRCADLQMDAGWSGSEFYEKAQISASLRIGSATGTIVPITSGDGPKSLGIADSEYITVEQRWVLPSSSTYYIRFDIDVASGDWNDYDVVDIRFDEVYAAVEYAESPDVTWDLLYRYTNTGNSFKDKFEDIVYFGDSDQDNDIGALMSGSTRTALWQRYGVSESLQLPGLHAKSIITNFGKYKQYLRLQILDDDNEISPHSLLTIDSKDFMIVSAEEIYGGHDRKVIEAELVEELNETLTLSASILQLSTQDGNN